MFADQSPGKSRLLAVGMHLGISLAIAALAAWLVFAVWYPYREISGGRELFLIVVVDVIMGPLLTLTVFNIRKPTKELRHDLAVIGLLQLAALAYGLWTVAEARPMHLVFELDRLRVVHAVDVPQDELVRAPAGLQRLPLTGQTLLSLREFKDPQENLETTMAAPQGVNLGARPLAELKARFPARAAEIDAAVASAPRGGDTMRTVGYIPMAARRDFWTVLLDIRTAEVIAFVPIDSF